MNETRPYRARGQLTASERRIEAWPMADTSKLSPPDRQLYEQRYQAVCGYMHGESLESLSTKWGLSRWGIIRLRNRCLLVHPDGRLWGFRGLLPRIRTRIYVRIDNARTYRKDARRIGYGGLLGQLVEPMRRGYRSHRVTRSSLTAVGKPEFPSRSIPLTPGIWEFVALPGISRAFSRPT
jgi:hypothetical protein